MIAQSSIERIKEIPVEDVVALHVKLKKSGANYTGCCPFHDEKTPSFSVSAAKGKYKCFGCGKSGDGIQFIIEKENKTFYEAIEKLADVFKIPVEYENDGRTKEEFTREKDEKAEAYKILRAAQRHYETELRQSGESNTRVQNYIANDRGLSLTSVRNWQLGYSSENPNYITERIKEPAARLLAEKNGLLKQKDGAFSDVLKNRITIPIHNHHGQLVGFGGRKLPWDKFEGKPKYLNPKDSFIYDKSKILFGLDKASKAIAREDFVILVEGYFDVIKMHQNGFDYTVATCGTALTLEQCKLLSRYTKNILILRDGDNAGKKATKRDIPILKNFDFNIFCAELPHGQDPDSFCNADGFVYWLMANIKDGLQFEFEFTAAEHQFSPEERLEAFAKILAAIKRDTKREMWMEKAIQQYKFNSKILKAAVKKILEIEDAEDSFEQDLSEKQINQKLAKHRWLTKAKKEEAFNDGFTTCEEPMHFGYWFTSPGFDLDQMTNFIIRPLFSVNEPVEKFELAEIVNRYGSKIMEVPAGTFTSMNSFEKLLWEARSVVLGNFNQQHLRKLNAKNITLFKEATLVRTLGMQPEGFWSYADAIFHKGQLMRYDKTGIATIEKQCYYSPGAAEHNRNSRKDEFGNEVTEGDPYRNDKFLNYTEAAATFEEWSQQMMKVFGNKGMNAISTVILAVFKDVVTSFEKLPIPYGYGDAETGKSVWGERIFYFFFGKDAKPFNLNSGTIFTFFNTLERFKNCAFLFNEFDEDTINDEFFRAFKQAHDGEGRNKGMMGTKVANKSTEQPINVVPVLIGQILSTKDGGSVLSRSVPEKFISRTYSDEEKEALDVLKRWEKKGMNGAITELLAHRAEFRKDFFPVFNHNLSRMKAEITKDGGLFKERIARNHCIMLTGAELMARHFKLGFAIEDYYSYLVGAVVNLTEMVNESNNLGVFWSKVSFMFEQQAIEEGFDYKIVTESEIKVTVSQDGRKVDIVKKFDKPTKLLMLRLTSIFPLFEQLVKQSSGTKSINQKALISYFENNKAFIGSSPTSHFKSNKGKGTIKTSSFVFEYEPLKLNIERNGAESEEMKPETITGKIGKQPEKIKVGEAELLKFSLTHYRQQGMKTTTVYTTCFVPVNLDCGLMADDVITVSGHVTEVARYGGNINRSMDVVALNNGEAMPVAAESSENAEETFEFPE